MSSPQPEPDPSPLFQQPIAARSGGTLLPWGIAFVAVLVLAGVLFAVSRHAPALPAGAILPLDPYAPKLVFSDVQMSESTSLSGGKYTYIDGHVRNTGGDKLTGATVQVLFGSFDNAAAPQVESVPLNIIRTHEPYVDTEALSEAPLGAGEMKEFRLIFENITPNWNQQVPEIHVVQVTRR